MEPRSKKARFGEVSEDAELQALDARTPMSTKTATTFWLGVFESFCVEKEIVLDLKSCSASELDEVLGKFYLGLRMKNGERYKKASYLAARAAISRYMAVDLSKPTCNVFRQAEFQRSNNILDGVLKQAKASGEERAVEHKEAITADDLEKIRRYFDDVLDVGDPVKLTQFCWFHLSIHFALRSKEIQTTIRKSDIVFETDSEGKEYASLRRDFLAKNCPGGIKGREYESCGRLQEPRQVEALKKLLAKLHPGVERLFQRGLKGNQPESKPTWFMKAPLGHTVLGDMLPRISEAARLSRRYTNHCLRATSVSILKDSGFDDRAVCRLTGHKNPQSLESYCRSSENEKQALARALDGKMCRSRDVKDSSSSSKAAEMTTSCSLQDSFAFKNSVIHNLTINIKSEGDAS